MTPATLSSEHRLAVAEVGELEALCEALRDGTELWSGPYPHLVPGAAYDRQDVAIEMADQELAEARERLARLSSGAG